MTINRALISGTLRPGAQEIFGLEKTYPDQWKEIFTTVHSRFAQEFDYEMQFTGAAVVVPEGSNIPRGTMMQKIQTTYIPKKIALSYEITREALEDNLYPEQFPKGMQSLRDSCRLTQNTFGANVLNLGFSTNPAYALGDGQPLFSQFHPIDGGNYSNILPIPTDLSEAALEQAINIIQSFPLQSGNLAQTLPETLFVHRNEQFAASRLLNSQLRVGTTNHDINAIYHNDYIPKGYRVNQYLTNPNFWMIKTNAVAGFKHIERIPVKVSTHLNDENESIIFVVTQRYAMGVSNPRAAAGSQGS